MDDLQTSDVLTFGPFRLSPAKRELKKGEKSISIGGRALDVLITLAQRAGEIVAHKQLIASVWPDVIVEEANLRVHIAALRKILGDGVDGVRYISNIAGRGYCFVAVVTRTGTTRTLEPPAATAPLGGFRRLPALTTRMVGRDELVRSLLSKMTTCRLVTIVGPGGVGKTTVAIAVAHTLLKDFQGAVFFVDLSALVDPGLVTTAVASTLGFMMRSQDPLIGLIGVFATGGFSRT